MSRMITTATAAAALSPVSAWRKALTVFLGLSITALVCVGYTHEYNITVRARTTSTDTDTIRSSHHYYMHAIGADDRLLDGSRATVSAAAAVTAPLGEAG